MEGFEWVQYGPFLWNASIGIRPARGQSESLCEKSHWNSPAHCSTSADPMPSECQGCPNPMPIQCS
eukprot:643616-Pyramimonas_sp.AAC.1